MDIQVGEYVRTKKGIIGKLRGSYLHGKNIEYPEPQEWVIDRFNNKKNYYVISECDTDFDNIVKHSKNIINLIEVGDFVNGKCCIDIEEGVADDGRRNLNLVCLGGSILELSNKIYSVLTKEQYEANCYRLEA